MLPQDIFLLQTHSRRSIVHFHTFPLQQAPTSLSLGRMPSYESSGDKVATRGSFIFDPRLRAHHGIPDHYAPKPALGGFSSPMPSTHGRKRGRSPNDDSNLEPPLASRLSSKRVRTDVSEDGEIAEEGTESQGRSFELKDSDYPVAVKEKSPDGTYSHRKDCVGSGPQQSRGSLQTSNGRPQSSATAPTSSRSTSLPEPRPVARGSQILQPQQPSWKSLVSSNVPLERLSHLLPSLPTKDQASILYPLRRGESVVVYGRHSE